MKLNIRMLLWGTVLVAIPVAGAIAMRDRLAAFALEPAQAAETATERPPQPVQVTRILPVTPDTSDSYTGTVRPSHELQLGFRVPGKLVTRHVDVGERVAQGQILATLDDTDAQLELQSAEAEESAARIDLVRASADLDRARGLFADGHIAQAALDRAISVEAEAASRADRAGRARILAQNRMDYTALTAEADGVVTEVLAEPGQVLPSGQPVVVLARTDTLDVVFALPEQDLPRLSGATATTTLWDEPDRSYALTLRDVSPDVDPTGRTYRVRMWLEAPDAAVSLGRTATVTLSYGPADPVIALPLAAIMNDGAGASVWRIAGQTQTLERVPVEVAAIEVRVALVRADLAPGDAVVSLGAHKLDPARPVRVVEIVDIPER